MQPFKPFIPVVVLCAFFSASLVGAPSKPKEPKKEPGVEAYNKGTALLYELEFAEAEKYLREAISENPKMAEAHNNLAYALRKQGEESHEEARKHYDESIRLSPELPQPYMYRGVLLVTMGKKEAALMDHARLVDLSSPLAEELEHVIETGEEKTPERFFGVTEEK